jgi:serine/threonine protein kinase
MIRETDEGGDVLQFPVTFGQYSYVKTIGRGVTGVVILVVHCETGDQFACKVISHSRLKDPKTLQQLMHEAEVLRFLRHPHIVEQRESFSFEGHFFIVMEYVSGGELVSYLSDFEATDPAVRRRIFMQLCSAMNYLHCHGIVHRDLKPHNILLDENLNVKLCDFGFSRHTEPDALLTTPCGSPDYVAPEVLLGKPYDGMKADIWSLGVVLFVIETGRIPWTATNNVVLFHQISNALYEVPVTVDEDLAGIINDCLNLDPARRSTAGELVATLTGRPRAASLGGLSLIYGQSLITGAPRPMPWPRVMGTPPTALRHFPPGGVVLPMPGGRGIRRGSSHSRIFIQPLPPRFKPRRSGE